MKILEYLNVDTYEIIKTNIMVDPLIFKKLKWIDDNGDYQEHPSLLIPFKYWKKIPGDYPEEMSQAEKDVVDAADLGEKKTEKIAEIQANTAAFYRAGFEHPDNNLIKFGLDTEWSSNWNAIRADFLDEANPNDNFPYEVGTLDGEDYIIPNYQEFKDIYKAGKARKKYLIKGERMILQDIKQADTIAEIEAITDDRV